MESFVVDGKTYRIKQMNAVELLAMRASIDFSSVEAISKSYYAILERMEVEVKGSWLQVKQGNDYYPADLENNVGVVEQLISKFVGYLSDVFTKSGELNSERK